MTSSSSTVSWKDTRSSLAIGARSGASGSDSTVRVPVSWPPRPSVMVYRTEVNPASAGEVSRMRPSTRAASEPSVASSVSTNLNSSPSASVSLASTSTATGLSGRTRMESLTATGGVFSCATGAMPTITVPVDRAPSRSSTT